MASESRTIVEQTLQLAERVFRELLPTVPEEWLKLDLTMPQLKVALTLFLEGRARMSALASGLGVSLATSTGIVDRMVERGLVVREDDPTDRRVVVCRLSEKGQGLMSGLWQLSRDRSRSLLAAMPPASVRMLHDALEALLEAGRAVREPSNRRAR